MRTKRAVCEKIIQDFEKKNGGVRVKEQDAFSSSMVAVAMEYLGLVKDTAIKEYCASRDGILKLGWTEGVIEAMTLRELLATLPEDGHGKPKTK